LKRIGVGLVATIAVGSIGGGAYAWTLSSAYDASMDKVYAIAPLAGFERSSDPAVIARGKHLVASLAGCGLADCHGSDLGGGKVIDAGPVGSIAAPNITQILPAYTDAELARLIRHGVKKDQRTVRFMSVQEFNWLTDADVRAVVSYVRTVPPVDRVQPAPNIKLLGKVLDQRGELELDIARRIDHDKIEIGPAPSPTADYGKWVSRLCAGCHGEHMSGGPIPGAPSDFAVPLNLTPHESGLKGWTQEDFEKVMASGVRKDGRKLAELMPTEAVNAMDDVERKALFLHLQALPPRPFGQR
jgi:cytochrome c553